MKTQTHIILSDMHVPFHDKSAVELALHQVKKLKPDGVHFLGDILDFDQLSRFPTGIQRKTSLKKDMECARKLLETFRDEATLASMTYSEGNHEYRLAKYLRSHAPELESLRGLTIPELLDLKTLGIRWYGRRNPFRIGNLWLTHGHLIRSASGATARAMVTRATENILHGHTHRLGTVYSTTWRGQFCGIENGCLCRMDLEYLHEKPDWQLGWSVVSVCKGCVGVEQVHIQKNYQYVFRGNRYSLWSCSPSNS